MNRVEEKLMKAMPNPYMANSYRLWWHTPIGGFLRWLLLGFTAICFGDPRTWFIMAPAMVGFIYMPVAGLTKRVHASYRFLYGPTPTQLIRSFNKSWPTIEKGPVQKTIKISPPTP